MTKSCQLCEHSVAFTEADRIGLRCGLDNREIIPPLGSHVPCIWNIDWMHQRAESIAQHCPEYRPEGC